MDRKKAVLPAVKNILPKKFSDKKETAGRVNSRTWRS